MAAISSIRKHGVALMLIIGFALLAFILGDLSQVTRTFSNKNLMAKIDGKKMDRAYSEQYEQNTALMRLLQNKSSFDENETYQIHEMTWRQMLQDAVMDKQLKALGLQYNDQMIEDFKADMLASLSTARPNQYLAQFANALANLYGVENTMSILSNIEDYANNDQVKDLYNAYQAIVHFALSAEKASHYSALVQNTMYFSDPMAKQLAKDNQMALVSILPVSPQAQAFNGITASVSEKEMKDFYKQHKEIFTVYEKNRDIDVAIFPINPQLPDTMKAGRGGFLRRIAQISRNSWPAQIWLISAQKRAMALWTAPITNPKTSTSMPWTALSSRPLWAPTSSPITTRTRNGISVRFTVALPVLTLSTWPPSNCRSRPLTTSLPNTANQRLRSWPTVSRM